MQIRSITKNDIQTIRNWGSDQKWALPKDSDLPPTGFLVEGVCACWIFKTDGSLALLEPLVGNPAISKEKRSEGLNRLFETVVKWSKDQGFKHLMAMSEHPELIKRGATFGFKPLSNDIKTFLRSE